MTDSMSLLHDVQMTEFALIEANLFLDTHPNDMNAQEYFMKYKEMNEKAVAAYTAAHGPLTAMQYSGGKWKWTDGPFPWEQSANV